MTVSVIGRGKAVRMDFDDVLVKIEVAYQNPQSTFCPYQSCVLSSHPITPRSIHTTSFIDTGAFSDSAISCPVSLILIFRVRTVLIASPRLFCAACLFGVPLKAPFVHDVQLD